MSSKDSGHGDSEQGDSDHDAMHRGHSAGKFIQVNFYFSLVLLFIKRRAASQSELVERESGFK